MSCCIDNCKGNCCPSFDITFEECDESFDISFGDMVPSLDADNYEALRNKPRINDIIVQGEKVGSDYNLQDKLIPGLGITITENDDHTATIEIDGGASSGELSSDLVVSNPMGKYSMDETIPEGTGFETIFRGLLSKTYYPSLTNPSCVISYSIPTLAKVGAQISSSVAKISFNRGSINPKYTAESEYRAGEATNFNAILNGSTAVFNQHNTSGEFTIPAFTRNSKGNVTLTATVDYAEGVQPKDSDGADYGTPLAAGNASASKSIEFILPFYWGKNADIISTLDGFTEDLSKKGNKTYTYSGADNEYLYLAYDVSYGELKRILDENNLDNNDTFEKSTMTYEGQEYIVYKSVFAITGGPAFKFEF